MKMGAEGERLEREEVGFRDGRVIAGPGPDGGAVVANAIFDATGARLYQMPMTEARVKEALLAVRPG
jgi:capsular polysaccharide biosynthesis protein